MLTSYQNSQHAKRNVGGIFLCLGADWTGTCGYTIQPLNACIDLGSDWKQKISSIGPDPGTEVSFFPILGAYLLELITGFN